MIRTQVVSDVRVRRAVRKVGFGSSSLLLATLAAAAFAPGAASAQSNLKIGVINVGRLLEAAPQSKAVNDKLTAEFGKRQSEILGLREKLQKQQDSFQRDQAVMGEEERAKLEREIREGQRDLQRTENEYLEDLNVRRNEEVGKLQREVLQRVQTYASAQKFDLVIADAIYFSSAVDITAAVLQIMQAEGGGAAKAPAPASAPKAPAAPKSGQ